MSTRHLAPTESTRADLHTRKLVAVSELESGTVDIKLSGRMDIIGTQQIDLKFAALPLTHKRRFWWDLSKVAFEIDTA